MSQVELKYRDLPESSKYPVPQRGSYNFKNVPMDDPRVFKLFEEGRTVGVFQLEKKLGQDWSRKLKPNNIEELAALVALLRPGPLECLDGNVKIARRQVLNKKHQECRFEYIKIKDLYDQWSKWQLDTRSENHDLDIISIDEKTNEYFVNKIEKVVKTGSKEVFKVKVRVRRQNEKYDRQRFYNIKATKGHRFYTLNGWKELKDIEPGEYICVSNHYLEKTADVNHTKGSGDSEKKQRLPNTKSIRWVRFEGVESCGIVDTYDISVRGPNHNYLAGGFVVHNSGMSQSFVDRKHGREDITYIHPMLEEHLNETYGTLTYQEQAMNIAIYLAGFNLVQADNLRKAIGKKKPEEMAKVKVMFMEEAKKRGHINEEIAAEIFGWIEKSVRYSFNKCITPDATVETPTGFKILDELSVGDFVNSPNGFVEVVEKFENGIQDVYEITTDSGKTIKCTGGHKFLCEDGKTRSLMEILRNDYSIVTNKETGDM